MLCLFLSEHKSIYISNVTISILYSILICEVNIREVLRSLEIQRISETPEICFANFSVNQRFLAPPNKLGGE